jgi:branched-chain amino acid transport system permease protein
MVVAARHQRLDQQANTPPNGLRMPIEIGPVRVLLGQAVILAAAVVLVVGLHLFLTATPTQAAPMPKVRA